MCERGNIVAKCCVVKKTLSNPKLVIPSIVFILWPLCYCVLWLHCRSATHYWYSPNLLLHLVSSPWMPIETSCNKLIAAWTGLLVFLQGLSVTACPSQYLPDYKVSFFVGSVVRVMALYFKSCWVLGFHRRVDFWLEK